MAQKQNILTMAYSREDLGFTRPSWLDWLTYGGVEGHVELETMRERILSRMGTMDCLRSMLGTMCFPCLVFLDA